MKNLYKLIGIVALVAIIGFSMSACKDEPEPEPEPWYVGAWTGSGNVASIKLTKTTYSFNNGEEVFSGSFSISETNDTSGTMTFGGSHSYAGTHTYTRSGNSLTMTIGTHGAFSFTK